jgi:hypothetical protein
MGVHLTGVHLTGVHLIGVFLICQLGGVHFTVKWAKLRALIGSTRLISRPRN